MVVQTLDQKRAAHAWKAVEAFMKDKTPQGVPTDKAKRYAIQAKKLPVRIIASGLGQSLAFLLAKNYCPELLNALAQWCLKKTDDANTEGKDLLQKIVSGSSEDLRRYTAEALAYLQWLGRFVEGTGIKGEESA